MAKIINRVPFMPARKVGGIVFVSIGQWRFSYCKRVPDTIRKGRRVTIA